MSRMRLSQGLFVLAAVLAAGQVPAAATGPFVSVTPEIRTAYQSLGKIVEDRPMQITNVRFGYATADFGRFGVRNWDVSSLTDRRHDAHRHAIYHWEFGPTWEYDLQLADGWKIHNDLTRSWTIYQGFHDHSKNLTYHWWQIDQSLENPYLVPFYRIRRAFHTSDYLYFKAGVRRKFAVWRSLYVTPSVFVEGGNARHFRRVFGRNENGGDWGAGGVSSVSFRLETGWDVSANFGVFAFVEQYEVTGGAARDTNDGHYDYACAHNDWTHGGVGVKIRF